MSPPCRRRCAALAPLAVLALSCSAERVPSDAPGETPRWTIDPEPSVWIGATDAEGHDLFQVRGAVALADGGMAVLTAGTFEVRRFTAGGALRDRLGGPGEGPGEFRAPTAIGRGAGDTLVVFDAVLRRLSRFAPDGTVADETAFNAEWASGRIRVAPGGDLVVLDVVGDAPIDPVTGVRRRGFGAWRVRLPEASADPVGTGPGAGYLIVRTDRSERARLLPFSPQLDVTGSRSHTFTGDATDGRVTVRRRDGTVVGSFVAGHPGRPVTPALREAMIAWRASVALREDSATVHDELDAAPIPATLPAFGELLADSEGLLWVGDVWRPGLDSLTWTVWDTSGTAIATLLLPADLRPTEIRGDLLVGIRVDGDGLEAVGRWGVHRDR